MTSFPLPPPAFGEASIAGLRLPNPPPGLGSKLVNGAAAGSKAVGGATLKIVGGAAAGVFMDLAFPQSAAVSDLSALPKDLYNSGLGDKIQEESQENEPILNGIPGTSYTFDVVHTRINNSTGSSQERINGSYVSHGQFGLALNVTSTGSKTLILFRSLSSGQITQTSITNGGSNVDIVGFQIINIRTVDPEYAPPNDTEDNIGYKPASPGVKTSGGIVNLPQGYTPPPNDWTPYGGAISSPGGLGDPISNPPGVNGGSLDGGVSVTGTGGGVIGGGVAAPGGTGQGGSGGSIGGGLGGSSESGSGGSIGTIPPSVGGDTTQGGNTTVSGGGTTTGSGVNTGSPSETVISSPTNTGQNTASVPDSIPVNVPGIGTVENVPVNSGEFPPPGTAPFPPGTDLKPGEPKEITKNPDATKPATETPEPPDKEPKDKEEKPRIIPIPFDLNADNCCKETNQAIEDLANDLECVIEKICKEDEELVLEFLKVTVIKDPSPNKVMNPSTNGQYQDIVIAGYVNWVVQGKSVGEQIPVRRREELFLIPEWAEGWEIYPCHQAEFTTTVIEVPQGNQNSN